MENRENMADPKDPMVDRRVDTPADQGHTVDRRDRTEGRKAVKVLEATDSPADNNP